VAHSNTVVQKTLRSKGVTLFFRFLEDPVGNNDDALISSAMDAGEYGALAKEAKTSSSKKDLGDIEKILAGFTKNRSNIKKAKAKPKAGPKGNVKKMMNGGKVMGYKDGGEVCRGGGAATSGTKFRGVK
jgi:hypothetical protein